MNWGRGCPIDFNARKNQLVSCDSSEKSGAIDKKMVGPAVCEKS